MGMPHSIIAYLVADVYLIVSLFLFFVLLIFHMAFCYLPPFFPSVPLCALSSQVCLACVRSGTSACSCGALTACLTACVRAVSRPTPIRPFVSSSADCCRLAFSPPAKRCHRDARHAGDSCLAYVSLLCALLTLVPWRPLASYDFAVWAQYDQTFPCVSHQNIVVNTPCLVVPLPLLPHRAARRRLLVRLRLPWVSVTSPLVSRASWLCQLHSIVLSSFGGIYHHDCERFPE